MLSKDLEVTLNQAFKNARAKRHEFMTVEHLLFALLDNAKATEVLTNVGADLDALRSDLGEFIETTTPLIPAGDSQRETEPTLGYSGPPTSALSCAIERSSGSHGGECAYRHFQ